MKKILLLGALLSYSMAWAQNTLEIKIDKIKNNNGNIIVGLYNKDNHFPRNANDGKIVKADKNGVTVVFKDLKPGTYAVSVLHDENENKDMDQNKLGIPKEGFGFSNNVMGAIGPPSFNKAHIDIGADKKDTSISIDMKYMGKKKNASTAGN